MVSKMKAKMAGFGYFKPLDKLFDFFDLIPPLMMVPSKQWWREIDRLLEKDNQVTLKCVK